jgi:hypothetical protein
LHLRFESQGANRFLVIFKILLHAIFLDEVCLNGEAGHRHHTIPSGCQSSWRLKRADPKARVAPNGLRNKCPPKPPFDTVAGAYDSRQKRGVTMTYMIAIMLAPWLAATGIYHPQVVDRHGRCLAQPGSFDAIYCSGSPAAPPHHVKKYRAR